MTNEEKAVAYAENEGRKSPLPRNSLQVKVLMKEAYENKLEELHKLDDMYGSRNDQQYVNRY